MVQKDLRERGDFEEALDELIEEGLQVDGESLRSLQMALDSKADELKSKDEEQWDA
jgi:hypothetical protein